MNVNNENSEFEDSQFNQITSFRDNNFSVQNECRDENNYDKLASESINVTVNETNMNDDNLTKLNNLQIIYKRMTSQNTLEDIHDDDQVEEEEKPSPRFTSGRDLIDNIKIYVDDNILDQFISHEFSFTKCKNVTTVKFEEEKFSFLTNPYNDENFFFIKIHSDDLLFSSEEEIIEIEKNYKSLLNVSLLKLRDFVYEINEIMDKVNFNYLHNIKIKKVENLMGLGIITVLSIVIFILFNLYFNFFTPTTKIIFNILFVLISVLVISNLIYKYKTDRNPLYLKFDNLLIYQDQIESLVNEWNQNRFSKLDIRASVPRGLHYIQFTLKENLSINVESHPSARKS